MEEFVQAGEDGVEEDGDDRDEKARVGPYVRPEDVEAQIAGEIYDEQVPFYESGNQGVEDQARKEEADKVVGVDKAG